VTPNVPPTEVFPVVVRLESVVDASVEVPVTTKVLVVVALEVVRLVMNAVMELRSEE
jgi:hypothetical protein